MIAYAISLQHSLILLVSKGHMGFRVLVSLKALLLYFQCISNIFGNTISVTGLDYNIISTSFGRIPADRFF